ncbi:MAG: AraC family transcriptional regulator [Treponema sp.]|nr:AraC family transcriptional regulator [Treponema sp.]
MDNWTLDDIAQGIAINKSYLCHVFKKSEGMTVMAYPPKTPRSRGKPFAKKYRPYCVNRRRALFCGSGALWTLV